MAEPGNGQFDVTVGNKSIGIGGKDAVYLLFVAMIGALGYFVGTQLTTNQREGMRALTTIVEKLNSNQVKWMESFTQLQTALIDLVHSNRQEMEAATRAQNTLIHQETVTLIEKVEKQSEQLSARFEHVESKFEKVDSKLDVLNHNIHRDPSDMLPLDAPLPARRSP